MYPAGKKIIAFVFILLGSLPLWTGIFMIYKKERIHQAIETRFEQQHLQTIQVPAHEVIWMDENEIRVQNSLFDIKTKKLVNGLYTFTGLYDEDENKIEEIERAAAEKSKQHQLLLSLLLQHIPVFCDQPGICCRLTFPGFMYRAFVPAEPSDPFQQILLPPPQG